MTQYIQHVQMLRHCNNIQQLFFKNHNMQANLCLLRKLYKKSSMQHNG